MRTTFRIIKINGDEIPLATFEMEQIPRKGEHIYFIDENDIEYNGLVDEVSWHIIDSSMQRRSEVYIIFKETE